MNRPRIKKGVRKNDFMYMLKVNLYKKIIFGIGLHLRGLLLEIRWQVSATMCNCRERECNVGKG